MNQEKHIERLDKILVNSGFGSRKDVRRILRSGSVAINGNVVYNFDEHVDIDSSSITVDGKILQIDWHCYLMLNKPKGYVCSSKSGIYPTVWDLLNEEDYHKYLGGELSCVGRLDLDTEGLLFLTTDGTLNHKLTSPKYRVPKTYFVQLEKTVSVSEQNRYTQELKNGIFIPSDGKEEAVDCLPADCVWKDFKEARECELTVYEGKFHEVKRMFLALGNSVIYLKRISMGGVSLDQSLQAGQTRKLTNSELSILMNY